MDDSAHLRVVSWSVPHNGTDHTGDRQRWFEAMEILARLRPHVVLRQQMTGADRHGQRALWAEARQLGRNGPAFIPYLTPETREAPPTGVFLDPRLCQPVEYHEHVTGMWHPVCNPVIRLRGALRRLSIASVHLCPHDAEQRASEARRLTTLAGSGMAAIIGGHSNSYPHRGIHEVNAPPKWSRIRDRAFVEHRTMRGGGQRRSDTRPDEILAGERDGHPPVFREWGHHAATVLEQDAREALAPTASLWRTDQAGPQREDRIYATPDIADALVRLDVLDGDDIRDVSDHALVMATFSLHRLRRALSPERGCAAAPVAVPALPSSSGGSPEAEDER